MSKKLYFKPTVFVVELQHQSRLLADSSHPDDWDGPVGYIPCVGKNDDVKLT